MSAEFDRVLGVLQRYISAVNARALLMRSLQEHGLSSAGLTRDELRRCGAGLRRGAVLFVEPGKRQSLLLEIDDVCGTESHRPESCALVVVKESDIGSARAEARRICDAVGATAYTMQKVATIVSELARNMILYASGGQVEIEPITVRPKRIIVRAVDRGPGIPNLDEIMAGQYKSRTGLGRGILGTKRLADHFDISTGATGTRIVAEVAL